MFACVLVGKQGRLESGFVVDQACLFQSEQNIVPGCQGTPV